MLSNWSLLLHRRRSRLLHFPIAHFFLDFSLTLLLSSGRRTEGEGSRNHRARLASSGYWLSLTLSFYVVAFRENLIRFVLFSILIWNFSELLPHKLRVKVWIRRSVPFIQFWNGSSLIWSRNIVGNIFRYDQLRDFVKFEFELLMKYFGLLLI